MVFYDTGIIFPVSIFVNPRSMTTHWTFLTNHAHVLLCLARDPSLRRRDLAERVGITERAVGTILGELAEAGVIAVKRQGRRNAYRLNGRVRLRHPVECHRDVGDLIALIGADIVKGPVLKPRARS